MLAFCEDPASLPQWQWFACYLTSGTHRAFYGSFGVVIVLILLAAPASLLLGLGGAIAMRSRAAPLRWLGWVYTSMVRGVPDIVFFLFVPIAVDQAVEYVMHRLRCPDWDHPVWRGNDFSVCPAAKVPLSTAPSWTHDVYSFGLALLAFALVFGAFAANTLRGAMEAVPRTQMETAESYGMTRGQAFRKVMLPQMWIYALPGLSNLWMILVKATPLLFLLGIQDIVYWARELGGAKTSLYTYPHPDWRVWYFLVVLVFYLSLTALSERGFAALMRRMSVGQATAEGERPRGRRA